MAGNCLSTSSKHLSAIIYLKRFIRVFYIFKGGTLVDKKSTHCFNNKLMKGTNRERIGGSTKTGE